ncbi:MAG: glycosyltransferase, partial [bacterium]|nr:glycosyltransferase [bacterium]
MPPLKVLHLDSEATWRGGEQQVAYLLHGLAERGVCNLLAAPPGSVLLARVPARDAKPCPLPLRAEWDIVSALRLARLIRRERPRLIHAHTAKAHTMAVVGRLLSRQRLPVVVSRRVCFPIQAHWFNNWKYQEADFYLPISHAIEAVLHEFGIPPERTEVVYSCIDPARFDGQSAEGLREEFGIPAEAVVIGNVAVCEALKDQATL